MVLKLMTRPKTSTFNNTSLAYYYCSLSGPTSDNLFSGFLFGVPPSQPAGWINKHFFIFSFAKQCVEQTRAKYA